MFNKLIKHIRINLVFYLFVIILIGYVTGIFHIDMVAGYISGYISGTLFLKVFKNGN